ncbi:unnamed protein product [Brassicogethes aeneus]|uniref:UPAR/Ly6 domain-containing protein n=1 Tax=Brassicogethes aeneus TaxID=1431903 RepID=A0A9P0FPX7_BRAAE|nr:unnamed protein product [Brassicogethes aeneus]
MFCFVFVSFSILCGANSLECYYCHQTTNACKDGQTNSLRTINCTAGEYCLSYKYATKMPDVTVIAVERGCTYLGNTTCEQKMPEKKSEDGKSTEKGISCKVCKTPLCNFAFHNTPVFTYYLGLILIFVICGL